MLPMEAGKEDVSTDMLWGPGVKGFHLSRDEGTGLSRTALPCMPGSGPSSRCPHHPRPLGQAASLLSVSQPWPQIRHRARVRSRLTHAGPWETGWGDRLSPLGLFSGTKASHEAVSAGRLMRRYGMGYRDICHSGE